MFLKEYSQFREISEFLNQSFWRDVEELTLLINKEYD